MIGKAKWFQRRKYTGWGLTPKTKEGWMYVAVLVIIGTLIQSLVPEEYFNQVFFIYLGIVLLDVISIMMKLNLDEFEKKAEAISERNASWSMVVIISFGILYQAYLGAQAGKMMIDPVLMIALFGGILVKSISNFVIKKKGI